MYCNYIVKPLVLAVSCPTNTCMGQDVGKMWITCGFLDKPSGSEMLTNNPSYQPTSYSSTAVQLVFSSIVERLHSSEITRLMDI